MNTGNETIFQLAYTKYNKQQNKLTKEMAISQ